MLGFCDVRIFLNGWQAAIHAIEERGANLSPRQIIVCVVAAIAASALFYCGIIFEFREHHALAALGNPRVACCGRVSQHRRARHLWYGGLGRRRDLAREDLERHDLDVVATHFTQARIGLLPQWLAQVHPKTGAPRRALAVVGAFTLLGVAVGRSAILPIVDMVSLCLALSIILCLIILLRRRRHGVPASYTVPGGTPLIIVALLGAGTMVGIAILQPWLSGRGNST